MTNTDILIKIYGNDLEGEFSPQDIEWMMKAMDLARAAALSTQSPKWVKASERLPEKNTDTIIWRGNGTIGREYYKFAFYGLNGNGYDDYDGIEWLDESPSSTHALQEKIDGLREALERVLDYEDKWSIHDIAKEALETYK